MQMATPSSLASLPYVLMMDFAMFNKASSTSNISADSTESAEQQALCRHLLPSDGLVHIAGVLWSTLASLELGSCPLPHPQDGTHDHAGQSIIRITPRIP